MQHMIYHIVIHNWSVYSFLHEASERLSYVSIKLGTVQYDTVLISISSGLYSTHLQYPLPTVFASWIKRLVLSWDLSCSPFLTLTYTTILLHCPNVSLTVLRLAVCPTHPAELIHHTQNAIPSLSQSVPTSPVHSTSLSKTTSRNNHFAKCSHIIIIFLPDLHPSLSWSNSILVASSSFWHGLHLSCSCPTEHFALCSTILSFYYGERCRYPCSDRLW